MVLQSTKHSSKVKNIYSCPFINDPTWVKRLKDLAQRRWKALRKNVLMLNLTRNASVNSHHFGKEKISTDVYMGGDPDNFAWNNWGKPPTWRRPEKHKSAKPWISECPPTQHVMFHRTWVASVVLKRFTASESFSLPTLPESKIT